MILTDKDGQEFELVKPHAVDERGFPDDGFLLQPVKPIQKKQNWEVRGPHHLGNYSQIIVHIPHPNDQLTQPQTAQAVAEAIKALMEAVNTPFDIPELESDEGTVSRPLLKVNEAIQAARKARR